MSNVFVFSYVMCKSETNKLSLRLFLNGIYKSIADFSRFVQLYIEWYWHV